MRLDLYLHHVLSVQSRNKAKELIQSKKVMVNNVYVRKASYEVLQSDCIEIVNDESYVSRSAYKLKYFLDETDINLSCKCALDIGSSTGGFTQVLLEKGVESVTCVDVGSNQLHQRLRDDPRIILHEKSDIRMFKPYMVFDIITCDVAFISIHHLLSSIDRLAKDKIIVLFKAQFEVGPLIKRDRQGVVLDTEAIHRETDRFIQKSKQLNWTLQHRSLSRILGKDGNCEELFYFRKQ